MKEEKRPANSYLKYSSLGLQLLATIGLAIWLGYLVDDYLGLQFPVFLLLFAFASFVGMIYRLYKSINE